MDDDIFDLVIIDPPFGLEILKSKHFDDSPDYVFKMIDEWMSEVYRVLKPGASFFFRTPNKHHYVSIIGRVTPQWFHDLIANRARGLSETAHKPYPTFYRLNSKKDIIKHSRSAGFRKINLRFVEAEPSYLMFHPVPFLMGVIYERIVNNADSLSGVRANIFGRLEKNSVPNLME